MNAKANKKIMAAVFVAAAAIVIAGVVTLTNNSMNEAGENAAYRGHAGTFKNTLAELETPDPSIVYKDGFYYMTFTHNGTDVMVMKSRTLDFRQAERKVVWYPPVDTMYSSGLWAPEIQYLQGKWYIYFAADNGQNENHRMYVLEGDSDDPMGSYTFKGQVKDETADKWAIDGIALEHEGKLYFVWSGWEGDINIAQNTYIAPMSDPLTISGPRVLLSAPELEWEKAGGPPYINEGQSILKKDGRVFIVYSGAGSWTPFYSLGMLTLEPGADPLVADNWKKSEQPLLSMDEEAEVFGPGHNTFVTSPDGTEDWIVYHATSGMYDGWSNRKARAQKITWDEKGMPQFGKPLPLQTAIEVPSETGVFKTEHAHDEGNTIVFESIPSSVDTDAPLLIHYKNTTGASATTDVSVNGAWKSGTVELPATKEGETGYAYAAVTLQPEQNTIVFTKPAEGAELVAIEIPRFEAENAQTEGDTEARDNPFASGWGVVRTAKGSGTAVTFGNVSVPASGTYRLSFAVSNDSDQEQKIVVNVNGGNKKTLTVPPTERNVFHKVDAAMKLRAGTNQITLGDATDTLLVDYMDVVK